MLLNRDAEHCSTHDRKNQRSAHQWLFNFLAKEDEIGGQQVGKGKHSAILKQN